MAFKGSPVFEIKLNWARRPRRLALGRWGALLLVALLPIVAIWVTFATLYLVFHDDLLASLIKRQSDMQYAYEDRIAALKGDLDSLTGSGVGEAEAPAAAVRELAARSARLEARATSLEAFVARLDDARPGTAARPLAPALRFGRAEPLDAARTESGRLDALATSLGRTEAAELRAMQRLREPMLGKLARINAALEETGLSPSRWRDGTAALGGPFLPLGAAAGPDATLALLRETAREQERLGRVVATLPLRRPLDGALDVTSPFGPRVDPFLGRAAMHTGIDLHEAEGDAVRATGDGTVTMAGPDGGYGNLVEIDHGAGLVTRYGHLSRVLVAPGQHVAAGALVGEVGATGRATGPHLHYETRIAGEPVDPARFLKAAAILSP